MILIDLLTEMQKHLDSAFSEYQISCEAMCMYHIGCLHGLILKFIESEEPDKIKIPE